ncbi:methyltransferase domain-containing protein [Candidatus Sumerlaeota bacterium]|nr:methyltransferase domain-containing protein [Candidatus Sumerlaeota bacterium]
MGPANEHFFQGGGAEPLAKANRPQPSPIRTLGPISDLERHLPTDWWQTLFNSVYLKTDGDVVENAANTGAEVELLISRAGLEPNDHILDLCCGQGRHSLELARRGFREVTGVDRSRYLVRLARQRAKREGLKVTFREGDARRVRLPQNSFHCVAIMGNSFGYFEQEEDDLVVLRGAARTLRPGGTLALDLTDGDWMREHFEPRSWEWIDQEHFVCRERSLASDGQRLISREVVVHAERGVIVDQFYAERLYSEEAIRTLLDRAGFETVRLHGPVEASSERGQDLGMMAHRMFLTANAPRATATVSKRRRVLFPSVTVLLGDPTLPDTIKLDGHFNPEDIETVNRLKSALEEIEGRTFEFIDNHASLLTALRSSPPSFVFNLCDEGYNNEAFLELHVPAVLEMLGIPYTGAGPSCLGLCYNKALVRAIAATLDIPVPLETFFDPDDQSATLPSTLPALVKPNFGDSSVGITMESVVHSPEELIGYIHHLKQEFPHRPLLVQEFLTGAEYSIGIVGNPGQTARVLPPLEVDFSQLPANFPPILGYESKWDPASPYWTLLRYHQADMDEDTLRELSDQSMLLFERLGCRDYARFDFRADADGVIKLLEVNPNPGWCWDGKFNMMAGFGGLRYADLLRLILDAAAERVAAGEGNGHLPAPAAATP